MANNLFFDSMRGESGLWVVFTSAGLFEFDNELDAEDFLDSLNDE